MKTKEISKFFCITCFCGLIIIVGGLLIRNDKTKNYYLVKQLKKLYRMCFVKCSIFKNKITQDKCEKHFINTRGEHYLLITDPNKITHTSTGQEKCIFAWWHLTHVLLFTILGYMFPDNAGFVLFFGIIWELLESIYIRKYLDKITGIKLFSLFNDDAFDYMDILYNTIGFGIGYYIKNIK